MTAWNDFVKKIYHEGHSSDKNYSFKQALKDASARKSEMGKPNLAMGVKSKSTKKTKTSRKSRKSRKTKKNRSRRQRK
jgi:hypothetical protein